MQNPAVQPVLPEGPLMKPSTDTDCRGAQKVANASPALTRLAIMSQDLEEARVI
jgi:hypothetical protein